MSLELLVTSIATAMASGTAVLIAASGELLLERVGVYNIGIEGMMLVGALGGFAAASATDSVSVGLLAGIASGAGFSLLFGVPVVLFGADMIMAGLALVFIGLGLTNELGTRYVREPATAVVPEWHVPLLADIPYLGRALFQHSALVYVAALFPILVYLLLNHTRHGLNMRAIGESPATADGLGVSVTAWRLFYVVVGGAFAGLGGAFLSLGAIQTWLSNLSAGQGWIAFAVVIFAGWRPIGLILGAYVFGALGTLGDVGQALGWTVPAAVFSALPYLGTFAILVVLAWIRSHRRGFSAWPAALGQPFFRGAD